MLTPKFVTQIVVFFHEKRMEKTQSDPPIVIKSSQVNFVGFDFVTFIQGQQSILEDLHFAIVTRSKQHLLLECRTVYL